MGPHKMNGGYAQPPDAKVSLVGYNSDTKVPPAVPPRTRENSVNRQFQTLNGNGNPGLATVKAEQRGKPCLKKCLERVHYLEEMQEIAEFHSAEKLLYQGPMQTGVIRYLGRICS